MSGTKTVFNDPNKKAATIKNVEDTFKSGTNYGDILKEKLGLMEPKSQKRVLAEKLARK